MHPHLVMHQPRLRPLAVRPAYTESDLSVTRIVHVHQMGVHRFYLLSDGTTVRVPSLRDVSRDQRAAATTTLQQLVANPEAVFFARPGVPDH